MGSSRAPERRSPLLSASAGTRRAAEHPSAARARERGPLASPQQAAMPLGGSARLAPMQSQGARRRRPVALLLAACAGLGAAAAALVGRGGAGAFAGVPMVRGRGAGRRGDYGSGTTALAAVQKCEGEAFVDDAIAETGNSGVLVLSFSTTWCGPCKLMDPKVSELSETFAEGARFIKITGDSDPDGMTLMKRERVRSVPQYHVYKGGEKVDTITGAKYDDLKKSLERHTTS
uniref:Thioredoxin domain-containing protein n=1 Tax=Alexandrium catenella TaxID=2925 RepID=A0A7S1S8K1_ALECA